MKAGSNIESLVALAARQGDRETGRQGDRAYGRLFSASGRLGVSASSCLGGIILLEVILSLALFVAAATVAFGALNWSARACGQMRLEAQGADLAVSVLSEIQMGLLPVADSPAKNFQAPMQDWTWQIVTATVEDESIGPQAKRVEITVNNTQQNYTCRLVELMCEDAATAPAAGSSTTLLPRGQAEGNRLKVVATDAARARNEL